MQKRGKCICNICTKTFGSQSHLIRHNQRCHANNEHKCFICKKILGQISSLVDHLKSNHLSNFLQRYKCSTCKQDFKKKESLLAHSKVVDEGMKNKCELCEERIVYSTIFGLMNHIEVVHKENVVVKCIDKKRNLSVSENEKNHKPEKQCKDKKRKIRANFTMEDRLKLFAVHDLLIKKNRRLHEDECLDFAKEMNKTKKQIFMFMQNVRSGRYDNMRKLYEKLNKFGGNDKSQEHKCNICKKLFSTRSMSKIHYSFRHKITKHEEDKYSCNLCTETKIYTSWNDFCHHMRTCEGRNVQSSETDQTLSSDENCFENGKSSQIDKLQDKDQESMNLDSSSNSTLHEKDQFICIYCAKVFFSNFALNQHISNFHDDFMHECIHCKKKFRLQKDLITHILNVHKGKKQKCINCKFVFRIRKRSSLAMHLTSVHEVKKQKCTICDKIMASKCALWRHMKYGHREEIRKNEKISKNDINMNKVQIGSNLWLIESGDKNLDSDCFADTSNKINQKPSQQNESGPEKSLVEVKKEQIALLDIPVIGAEKNPVVIDDSDGEIESDPLKKSDTKSSNSSHMLEQLNEEIQKILDAEKDQVIIDDSDNVMENNQSKSANSNRKSNYEKIEMSNAPINSQVLENSNTEVPNLWNKEIESRKCLKTKTETFEQLCEIAMQVDSSNFDQEPLPLNLTYHKCVLCSRKYLNIDDTRKHLAMFHKIATEFQMPMIRSGSFC